MFVKNCKIKKIRINYHLLWKRKHMKKNLNKTNFKHNNINKEIDEDLFNLICTDVEHGILTDYMAAWLFSYYKGEKICKSYVNAADYKDGAYFPKQASVALDMSYVQYNSEYYAPRFLIIDLDNMDEKRMAYTDYLMNLGLKPNTITGNPAKPGSFQLVFSLDWDGKERFSGQKYLSEKIAYEKKLDKLYHKLRVLFYGDMAYRNKNAKNPFSEAWNKSSSFIHNKAYSIECLEKLINKALKDKKMSPLRKTLKQKMSNDYYFGRNPFAQTIDELAYHAETTSRNEAVFKYATQAAYGLVRQNGMGILMASSEEKTPLFKILKESIPVRIMRNTKGVLSDNEIKNILRSVVRYQQKLANGLVLPKNDEEENEKRLFIFAKKPMKTYSQMFFKINEIRKKEREDRINLLMLDSDFVYYIHNRKDSKKYNEILSARYGFSQSAIKSYKCACVIKYDLLQNKDRESGLLIASKENKQFYHEKYLKAEYLADFLPKTVQEKRAKGKGLLYKLKKQIEAAYPTQADIKAFKEKYLLSMEERMAIKEEKARKRVKKQKESGLVKFDGSWIPTWNKWEVVGVGNHFNFAHQMKHITYFYDVFHPQAMYGNNINKRQFNDKFLKAFEQKYEQICKKKIDVNYLNDFAMFFACEVGNNVLKRMIYKGKDHFIDKKTKDINIQQIETFVLDKIDVAIKNTLNKYNKNINQFKDLIDGSITQRKNIFEENERRHNQKLKQKQQKEEQQKANKLKQEQKLQKQANQQKRHIYLKHKTRQEKIIKTLKALYL